MFTQVSITIVWLLEPILFTCNCGHIELLCLPWRAASHPCWARSAASRGTMRIRTTQKWTNNYCTGKTTNFGGVACAASPAFPQPTHSWRVSVKDHVVQNTACAPYSDRPPPIGTRLDLCPSTFKHFFFFPPMSGGASAKSTPLRSHHHWGSFDHSQHPSSTRCSTWATNPPARTHQQLAQPWYNNGMPSHWISQAGNLWCHSCGEHRPS